MSQLAIGKIAKPFGVHGWLKLLSFSGEVEHFLGLKSVQAMDQRRRLVLTVEQVKPHQEGLVIKFVGYDSPEAARELIGLELWVAREAAAPCGDNEYYFADLVGCAVVHGTERLARVCGVIEGGPAGFLLEVETEEPKRFLVPFQEPFVGAVDIKARRVELLTPWILD